MKRTKRNNRRLKGGSGSNKKSSTRKRIEKVTFLDEDTYRINIRPKHTYAIDVGPDPTKSGPSILKVKESKLPDGKLPRPHKTNFTGVNQSEKYNLGRYDKTARCKKTGKKAFELENEEIRKSNKSNSKSKGGKKMSYKSRKTNKK